MTIECSVVTGRLAKVSANAFRLQRAMGIVFAAGLCMVAAARPSLAQTQGAQPSTEIADSGVAVSAAGVVTLGDMGHETYELTGPWRFHVGDDASWALPELDDSGWQTVVAGESWEEQGHKDTTGYAWYRMKLDVPNTARGEFALYLPYVEDVAEVYWKGRKVGAYGSMPPWPALRNYDSERLLIMPLGGVSSGELAIRVWKAPYIYSDTQNEGGLAQVPVLGTQAALEGLRTGVRYRWLARNLATMGIGLVSVLIGLLAVIAWARHRRNLTWLWLGWAMIAPILIDFVFGNPIYGVPFRVAYTAIGLLVASYEAALWLLLIDLLGLRDVRWLHRATVVLAAVAIGLDGLNAMQNLVDISGPLGRYLMAWDVGTTLLPQAAELWVLVIVAAAVRRGGLRMSQWALVVAATLADLVQALTDVEVLGQRWMADHLPGLSTQVIALAHLASWHSFRLANMAMVVAILYLGWQRSREEGQRKLEMEQEFRSAQEVQRLLLPERLAEVPGMRVASAYRPAKEVGGDFFQVLPMGENGLMVVVGDVSGKGLPAALLVALLVGAMRRVIVATPEPAEVLAALNEALEGRMNGGFATCIAARIDGDGRCTFANAGHLSPFIEGREVATEPGLPLGLVAGVRYEQTTDQLEAGERIAFYTDGLVEARNGRGELYGFARVATLMAEGTPAAEAVLVAEDWGKEDDITVVTVDRLQRA